MKLKDSMALLHTKIDLLLSANNKEIPVKIAPKHAYVSQKAQLYEEKLGELYQEDLKSFIPVDEVRQELEKVLKTSLPQSENRWIGRKLATVFSKDVKRVNGKTVRGFYISKANKD